MTDRLVKATVPKGEQPTRPLRPGRKANIAVRFVIREPVREAKDRPIHMADIVVPGRG